MSDIVECHSGYKYAEKPIALTWQDQHLEVVEILQRWRTPETICFRVRTIDGQAFELCYDEQHDKWQIQQQ